MTYKEAEATVLKGSWPRVCLGLEKMRQLDFLAGQPSKRLKFIHVAGTNGKGSTSTMISQILSSAGYKVGLFTSPSLQAFNERFQINGRMISDAKLCEIANGLVPVLESLAEPPTEFELITEIAFKYFAESYCDFVVLEAGLGGRLDATNIIEHPELVVITSIGLDHTKLLGQTPGKIAWEKAGIIKPGTKVILSKQTDEVCGVVRQVCKEKGASFVLAGTEDVCLEEETLQGQVLFVDGLGRIFLPLVGRHQQKNMVVAVAAANALKKQGAKISKKDIYYGLKSSFIPARFELLSKSPVVVLDGGHNPQCFEELARTLKKFLGKEITFVFGVLKDKDYKLMLRNVLPLAKVCYCVTPQSNRALPAQELCKYIKAQNVRSAACGSVKAALDEALLSSSKVCCCGSLYFAGEVRDYFGLGPYERQKLGETREV